MKSVSIIGTDLKRFFHKKKKTKSFSGRKRIKFNCFSYAQKRKSNRNSIKLASLSSPTGLISLKSKKYKGKLHVITTAQEDSCDVVNEINLEDYISSLLAKEMNAKWKIEALKAQAVAARTYALSKINKSKNYKKSSHQEDLHYDLESSEKDQVSGSFFDVTKKTTRATRETKGMILKGLKGSVKPIFFHAKCGGRTLKPDQVWENKVAEYKNVKCPYCDNHGKKNWKSALTEKRIRKFITWMHKNNFISGKLSLNKKSHVYIAPDKMKYYKLRIYVDERVYVINKSLMRRYFGRVLFKSNNFKINPIDNKYFVTGKGLGHGVGMCQLGALDLAQKGWGYKKILAHYFPNHKLTKHY